MGKRESVALILPNTLAGGAQRAILNVFNNLDKRKDIEVHLIILNDLQSNSHGVQSIPVSREAQNIHILPHKRVLRSYFSLRRTIKANNITCCLTTITHVNVFILLMNKVFPLRCPLVIRETNVLSKKYGIRYKRSLWYQIHRLAYNSADAIVMQSLDMEKDMHSLYQLTDIPTFVINNPVDINRVQAKARQTTQKDYNDKYIISLGHLTFQKNHDLLLASLSSLPVHCVIVGDGPERARLESLTRDLNLEDKVSFTGFKSNPYPLLANAQAIVLTSHFEGFPNVLVEAMALGTPIVANNCKGGINEIVSGECGLISDYNCPVSLNRSIETALTKQWDKKKIQSLARANYAVDSICTSYVSVFNEVGTECVPQ